MRGIPWFTLSDVDVSLFKELPFPPLPRLEPLRVEPLLNLVCKSFLIKLRWALRVDFRGKGVKFAIAALILTNGV